MQNGERFLYFWLGFLLTAIGFIIYSGIEHRHWPAWLSVEAASVVATMVATVVVALFTVRLSDSTEKLWEEAQRASEISSESSRAAKDAVDVSRQSLEVAQRAFVFCKQIQTNLHTVGKPPNERLHDYIFVGLIENSGSTPATDVRSRIDWLKSAPGTIPEFERFTRGEGGVFGPGTGYQTAFAMVPLSDMEGAFRGLFDLHVHVLIEYRDIFRPEVLHHHEMCTKVTIFRDPSILPKQNEQIYVNLLINGPQNSTS